jgi:acetyl-CoA decarbonylase/synthase complex subunit beta
MFEDIPVDVGVIYEGERIRRSDMYVELGGPDVKEKFELSKSQEARRSRRWKSNHNWTRH